MKTLTDVEKLKALKSEIEITQSDFETVNDGIAFQVQQITPYLKRLGITYSESIKPQLITKHKKMEIHGLEFHIKAPAEDWEMNMILNVFGACSVMLYTHKEEFEKTAGKIKELQKMVNALELLIKESPAENQKIKMAFKNAYFYNEKINKYVDDTEKLIDAIKENIEKVLANYEGIKHKLPEIN